MVIRCAFANARLLKTRPDTRQSSRGRLDRSGNAKNNSEFKNVTDGRTDRPTYRPTDTARCRVACPRLKTVKSWSHSLTYILSSSRQLFPAIRQLPSDVPAPLCHSFSRISAEQVVVKWIGEDGSFSAVRKSRTLSLGKSETDANYSSKTPEVRRAWSSSSAVMRCIFVCVPLP